MPLQIEDVTQRFEFSINPAKQTRPRGNRALGEEAERELRKLLERDEKALISQQEYEQSLKYDLMKSTSRSATSLGQLENAKLRHQLATELHDSLKRSLAALQLDEPSKSRAKICPADGCDDSQHVAEVASLLRKRQEIVDLLSEEVNQASESVTRAFESLVLAEMTHESAVIILKHQTEEQTRTLAGIKSLESIIKEKKIPLQACFRTPLNIWEEVFTYVVSADGEPQSSEPEDRVPKWVHGSRALMLSSVCHSWQLMVHSLPSLWRYIFIPLGSDFNRFRPRVTLYLKRCKAVQPIVAVLAGALAHPHPSFPSFPSFRNIFPWVQEMGIARLTFLINGGSYFDINSFIQELPAPATFIIRDALSQNTPTHPFHHQPFLLIPRHFFDRMKRLETSNVRIAPLVGMASQSTLAEYVHIASVSGRYALPSWIQSYKESIRFMRINASWPLDRVTPHAFPNVRELEIPLQTLGAYIRGGYLFPSIQKLTLLHTLNATNADWTTIGSMPLQDLRTIGVRAIEHQNVDNFIDFINHAQGVCALELHESAVLGFLTHGCTTAMSNCPKIETLTISGFHSPLQDLPVILQPIHALCDVVFIDCPKISRETRLEVAKLFNRRSSSSVADSGTSASKHPVPLISF